MKRIAILASGEGSNAEAIVKYFESKENVNVVMVLSNRISAGVHQRMKLLNIPTITYSKEQWVEASEIIDLLKRESIDLIVLAGFLAIIQPSIIEEFKCKIINIHPSLLPKFGGPGMWGMNVHKAVIESGDCVSGITIHYVEDKVDGGDIIAQFDCNIESNDTPEILAEKIHQLEYFYYPQIIEQVLYNQIKN